MTNENVANKILSTCIHLAVKILKDTPYCSFGFIGAPTFEQEDSYENTKRFRIYKLISRDLFGSNTFKHFNDPKQSAYLFVNNKEEDPEAFAKRAKVMFSNAYNMFETA